MTQRLPIDEAAALLESELKGEQQTFTDLDTEDAWLAFLRFGRRLFDVADTADADGLLFQYGIYSFDGPATFTLDLARQFEIADSDGNHDHYVQVHCELRYGPAPALQALGSFHSWFFHGAGDNLDEWAEELSARAAWTTIRPLRPTDIKVYQEQV
ncbi:hypothetical protein QF037_009335 [Streptomyces canus]|uniref:hypothetical protein n=1 Tax=Streptomyces canus TaxID=58343 RepID=UPI0027887A7A|nr:hypothetical protein [Streptomyces canus]MDQ0604990.1 hypothetical protein [Streptomyces canus]